MGILYIYNAEKNMQHNTDLSVYSYNLGSGIVQGKNISNLNNSLRFNELALELRDEYIEYIYSLNKLFLKNNFIHNKKFSLFFLTDLSNKRTENFETYPAICHIFLILEQIKNINIDHIIIDGCSKPFIKAIDSVLPNKSILHKRDQIKNKTFPFFLVQTQFFLKVVLQLAFLKIINFKNPTGINSNKCFLSRYPLHFNNLFKEEKYGKLVNDKDYYLLSIITDGMHQNLTIKDFIKYIRKLLKSKINFFLLDGNLGFLDIFNGFLNSILFNCKKKKIQHNSFFFSGINITDFIIHEIEQSFLRVPRLLMFESAICKFFLKNKINNFYYYLHEYCYGRFFTYVLQVKFPWIHKIGFQHGPASQRKLLYYLSKYEPAKHSNNFLKYLPIPDKIIAEDMQSKNIYLEAGYKNITIMPKIYRLAYLDNIERKKVVPDTILIACGLHDAILILELLRHEICNNVTKKYFIRFHPKNDIKALKLNVLKLNTSNIFIAEKELTYYLSWISEVVVTYSSVGYEADLLGIPVRVLNLPNRINESPLLDRLYIKGNLKEFYKINDKR